MMLRRDVQHDADSPLRVVRPRMVGVNDHLRTQLQECEGITKSHVSYSYKQGVVVASKESL